MADFEDELSSYLQARTASDQKEREECAAANAAADALFGTTTNTYPYPHPEGFQPTQDAPAFALHHITQMWHDATTGTFSYYDATSETYIPVEGPEGGQPPQQQQQQPLFSNTTANYYDTTQYVDPNTGYAGAGIESTQGYRHHYEAPPESDATLRLCVLSSNVLKLRGVILMDASGLSFGRDRPLSGQGKRVRMVEMEISRFHASVYLDRKQVLVGVEQGEDDVQKEEEEEKEQQQHWHQQQQKVSLSSTHITMSVDHKKSKEKIEPNHDKTSGDVSFDGTLEPMGIEGRRQEPAYPTTKKGSSESVAVAIDQPIQIDDLGEEKEEGEYPDSPGAGARDANLTEQDGWKHDKEDGEQEEGEKEDGEEEEETEEQQQYRKYQRQLQEYQHYYQRMVPPVYVDTFQITDCGSTHGTFLNGERLSSPKTASQPFALRHLDQLQLGSTIFEIHAHEEGRICGTCQVSDGNEIEVLDDKERDGTATGVGDKNHGDGTGMASPAAAAAAAAWTGDSKLAMERERIEEMNRLKKKWAGPADKKTSHGKRVFATTQWDTSSLESGQQQESREYVDRAAKRRMFNPDRSSPAPVPSVVVPEYLSPEETSGFHVPVAKTNKGHAMLSKMGWKAGTGLGATHQGVVEPVQLVVADRRAGLGSGALQTQGAAAAASVAAASRPAETPAEAARRKARERYAQLR
ncbi:hypothetical protein BGZ65_005305 [Modicella reniformis]|uniref:G-patch domain-containing protein n=1 Tax=Modicella reniformis TaxID=1440133 RepID=A0A9P6IN90_9FUNG|nr:hypothetical protein BGZ65_005305 [Modicella reniformis]